MPLVVCVLGACGFRIPGGTGGSDGGADDATSGDDARIVDAPTDTTAIVPCATPSTAGLVACYELEDGVTDGTLLDSAPAHAHASTQGLLAAQRTTTSAAATASAAMTTYAPDAPALDRASGYTVTMWVRPTAVPPSSRVYGLYDHELQYAGVIGRSASGSDAQLRCINTGHTFEYTDTIPLDTWSFVACTWDGTTLCAAYWADPTQHQRFCTSTTIEPDGNQGLAIGHLSSGGVPESPYVGSFDSLQLYDHPLTADELCGIAGQPAGCLPCTAGC